MRCTGPTLESKELHAIWSKNRPKKEQKRAKHLRIWAKLYKIERDYRTHKTARICPGRIWNGVKSL